ncbi:MAG: MBL fold metallo-hydrolase, partial [Clostridia bacterium]|nr:MBL fold metallo-hydrolase [Clostridia bacterium]
MLKKVLIAVVITAMLISLVACSQKQAVKEGSATVDKKEAISIKYAGNSCFWIVFPDGTKLMTDPYGKKYANAFAPFPKLDPDFVTLSHMHEDHIAGLYELDVNPQLIRPVKAVE